MLTGGSILYLNGSYLLLFPFFPFSFHIYVERNLNSLSPSPVNTTTAATATYLPTFFATTPQPVGTFAFQGDGVIWTAPNIPRQNTGAFLACGTGVPGVYINLGA